MRFLPRTLNYRTPVLCSAALLAALLVGCTTRTRAPVVDLSYGVSPPALVEETPASLPPAPPLAEPAVYIVKPGDTLYNIARATGASLDALIRANDIGDPDRLQVGQALRLSLDGSAPQPPTPAEPLAHEPAANRPTTPATTEPPPPRLPAPGAHAGQRASDAHLNDWGWPARGEVILAFTPATKGIDIAGTTGDPVHAAADGTVMYVGNGVRGLGNLVLIEHAGGFLSAYAHNQRLLVSKDQRVKRGAQIAELGQTDTSSPRLHFEVRRQGTPVNPLQYLPPRER